MKIVITGASGFIGKHLIENMVQCDVELIAITRTPELAINLDNRYDVLECDIHHPTEQHFNCIAQADLLIHLAWGGLPNYRSKYHFEKELACQYSFLKDLIQRGLKNIVVSGTCLEYGLLPCALSEDMQTNPVTAYGFAKDCLRRQLQFLQNDYDFNLTWMRLFYTYGEGQSNRSLFPLIKSAVESGKDSFDMSAGDQVRDYLRVAELVDLITKVAMKCRDGGVLNVCSGCGISVQDIVQKWMTDNNWKIKLNLGKLPYPDYEPMAFWGDRKKLDDFLSN